MRTITVGFQLSRSCSDALRVNAHRLGKRCHADRRCRGGRKGLTGTDYARMLDAAHQQLGGPIMLASDNLDAQSVRH
jgi:hypothetical protein